MPSKGVTALEARAGAISRHLDQPVIAFGGGEIGDVGCPFLPENRWARMEFECQNALVLARIYIDEL
ncbi:hypothetical protein [Actinacidiphila glaucinigra]|uniref:hypothetical protein n=1 Tax=Actinacidiphila glaucinigra TaxID=235986 RepID=UPI002E36F9A1|nr:hypothetical protein [Actinacidiphila glaucinigra]